MWRHGDVLIAAIDQIPSDATPRNGSTLAYGEVTGHSHRFKLADTVALWQRGDSLFVEVTAENAQLIHEEHAMIELPRGNYRVWMQREYSPQEIRRVVD